jgi:GT2 family glycosyltransferase
VSIDQGALQMFGAVFYSPAGKPGPASLGAAEPPRIDRYAADGRRPFWSVMIPVYNPPPEYLRETIGCVLAQDPGPNDMEIEVVDNCSTRADVEKLVRDIAGDRVRFYRQASNVGAIENFNSCIRRARGKWVHILHGDDTVRPEFYAHARQEILKHPDANALACRTIYMDGDGIWIGLSDVESRVPALLGETFVMRQLISQRIQFVGMVVKRSTYERLGGFRAELRHCTDWDMWNRIAIEGKLLYLPEPLACYRIHGAADTSALVRTGQNVVDEQHAIDMACSYVSPDKASAFYRDAMKEAAIRALRRMRAHWTGGERRVALVQLRAALRCSVALGVLARLLLIVGALIENRRARPMPELPAGVAALAPASSRTAPAAGQSGAVAAPR